MLPSHTRTLYDVANCQTEYFGGHLYECDHCGLNHYLYHSCCNRNCPKCRNNNSKKWLEKRKTEILHVNYYHVVFTLPEELRNIIRSNQKELLSILMKAAAYSIQKLAKDPHYVGGKIGFLGVLHTWSQTMIYHPHFHCLVPAGAISSDGKEWIYARKKYLVPINLLSTIFRARFMKLARKALPEHKFPQSVWYKNWNVYSKPSVKGPLKVLNYLARYVQRVAITNNRILSDKNGKITFSYKKRDKNNTFKWKQMSLPAMEFIRRFLQHVLPTGFHKVRYYGFLNPKNKSDLMRIKMVLGQKTKNQKELLEADNDSTNLKNIQERLCNKCKKGHLIFLQNIERKLKCFSERSPP